ncbi:MAG: signal recognition particle protein [Candidatus Aenigmarchaeota archaeon]|nr:signal recognition particle protein [Candidatus Aenigmarchaeota archaeon]
MLDKLREGLRGAIEKITRSTLVDKDVVDSAVRDIQRSLLASDVNVEQVYELSERIRKRSMEKIPSGLSRREHVIKVVYEELTDILGKEKPAIELKPKRILMAGLFGSGKTTMTAKLAFFYKNKGLRTAVICCDTFRPAAFEQLQQLSKKVEVAFYGDKAEKDSATILASALKKINADVIIVDSSGRDALDKELVDEIKNLNKMLVSDERILVIPADIGQAAREQTDAFHDALGITDVIITKMDATAKGGGALTACSLTGAKVTFISTGETPRDLEVYDPKRFVARLIGFPDLETLLEKAKGVVDEKKAEKMIEGDFGIEEFCEQIGAVRNMGPMSQMLEMAGLNTKKLPKDMMSAQEEKMGKWQHIIKSMTPEERKNPELIKHTRIVRIARGSGAHESEVRELLAAYRKSKKVIKKLSPGKLKRGGLGGLLKQFGA